MDREGFGCTWRKWINGCLSSAKFFILINGLPTDFPHHLVVFDKGILLPNSCLPWQLTLSAICFVNDWRGNYSDAFKYGLMQFLFLLSNMQRKLFFFQRPAGTVDELLKIIRCFELASGLNIYFYKSILSAGLDNNEGRVFFRRLSCIL